MYYFTGIDNEKEGIKLYGRKMKGLILWRLFDLYCYKCSSHYLHITSNDKFMSNIRCHTNVLMLLNIRLKAVLSCKKELENDSLDRKGDYVHYFN